GRHCDPWDEAVWLGRGEDLTPPGAGADAHAVAVEELDGGQGLRRDDEVLPDRLCVEGMTRAAHRYAAAALAGVGEDLPQLLGAFGCQDPGQPFVEPRVADDLTVMAADVSERADARTFASV